jgi:hypothetical protein
MASSVRLLVEIFHVGSISEPHQLCILLVYLKPTRRTPITNIDDTTNELHRYNLSQKQSAAVYRQQTNGEEQK